MTIAAEKPCPWWNWKTASARRVRGGKGTGMKARLVKLEEKVAFLEDAVQRMSKTVEELNVRVVSLGQEVRNLRRQASPIDESTLDAGEPPPHYGR